MLNDTLKTQLQSHLQRMTLPIELVASLNDSPGASEMRELLRTLAGMSELISVREDGQDERRPSFSIARQGSTAHLRFAAVPLGHEFTSLVLALLWAGGHPPKVEPQVLEQVRQLSGEHHFEVFMSLSCHNCPDVVQALSLMALIHPHITTTVIDGALYQEEVQRRHILAVPLVLRNGESFASGRMTLEDIIARLDVRGDAQVAAELTQRPPYDMLVVGGGPAGAAAAVYAARKGIRTGVVAERIGGQTNDTLGIENYISVLATDGPKFAAALESQMKAYDVDLMPRQLVARLIPADESGLIGVELKNGAVLSTRSLVLSTGARWRQVGVTGEEQYRNRGVAYCPHCDGPLFKGKRTAVIGGGNSGVEAAIDLAGIVAHVTLIEFGEQLKADAVLVRKLNSLPNVKILTQAQTLEITGDGQQVNGLRWLDRVSGQQHHIELEGVFVQIGLVPNTEFLRGLIDLNRQGEIVIDERGQTNLPGVFAAGDATTVPFKQIVIAAGEGAKAALSAFDHLIRQGQDVSEATPA
ncbi:MAG: alkyl hydroperoxide reductase subunit F [Alphaproteobacteria bacterium]|nr:alkyl hydroperoxide reductase subunit F [Alphaproteobacteria bacterium]